MSEPKEPKAFVVQSMKFFGLLPGQTLPQFSDECKRLTPKDREELAAMLIKEGFPVK